jgi:nitrite reductase/ring-hydroxylating ferredoxin subunit
MLAEISDNGKEIVQKTADGPRYLMLFRHSDHVHGYHNVCPHQGRNLNFAPDRFLFDPDGKLVCPHHGALFDVASGECLQGPCRGASLRAIDVFVDGDNVCLAD